ncbi:MAG: hypothetical protein LBR90_03940 [Elusimicrobiota bacterium]|jgi:hypothetical protein|nr:hypothetical protein [Elusimicrobiota bacterium]
MKNLPLTFVFLFFLAFNCAAQEFSSTTLLAYPIGIFEEFSSQGGTYGSSLNPTPTHTNIYQLEIGARPFRISMLEYENSYPNQKQYLHVYGQTRLGGAGATSKVNGDLVFGWDENNTFRFPSLSQINLYDSRLAILINAPLNITSRLYTENLSSAGNITTGHAFSDKVYGNRLYLHADPNDYRSDYPTINAGGNLYLYGFYNVYHNYMGGVPGFLSPWQINPKDEIPAWDITWGKVNTVLIGSTYHTYGPWRRYGGSKSASALNTYLNTDGRTIGDKGGEYRLYEPYTCKSTGNTHTDPFIDIYETQTPPRFKTDTVFFYEVRGRKECAYINDRCQYPVNYTFNQLPNPNLQNLALASPADLNQCSFTIEDYKTAKNQGTEGELCNRLCGNNGCSSAKSCYIPVRESYSYGIPDNLSSSTSGNPQWADDWKISGIDYADFPGQRPTSQNYAGMTLAQDCKRTGWPLGSGLECTAAWDDRSFIAMYCAGGSGQKIAAEKRIYVRKVKCAASDGFTTTAVDFLRLDDSKGMLADI